MSIRSWLPKFRHPWEGILRDHQEAFEFMDLAEAAGKRGKTISGGMIRRLEMMAG